MNRINPRDTTPPAPLPAFTFGRPQGIFGWEGACVDVAITADSVEGMQWAIDTGVVDHTTQTFFEKTLLQQCEERGAVKCAALLKKLGFPGRQPRNP